MLKLITIALLALGGLSSVSNAAPTGMSSLMNTNNIAIQSSDTMIPMDWKRDHTQAHQDIYSEAILKSALAQVISSHQMISKRDMSYDDLSFIFRSIFDMIIDNLIKMDPTAADAVTVNKDVLFDIFLNEINQLIITTVSGKKATGCDALPPSRVIMQSLAHTNATDANDTKNEYVPAAAIEHDGEKEVDDDATKWFSVFKNAAAEEYDTEKGITDEAAAITKEYSDEHKKTTNGAPTKAINDLKKVFDDAATEEYDDTKTIVDEIDTKEFKVEDSEVVYTKEKFDSKEYVTDADEYDSDAAVKDKTVTGGAVTTKYKNDKKITDKKVSSEDTHDEDEQDEEITKDEEEEYKVKDDEHEQDEYENQQDEEEEYKFKDDEYEQDEEEEYKVKDDEYEQDEEEEYKVKDDEYEQDEEEEYKVKDDEYEQYEEVDVKEEVLEYIHEHKDHEHKDETYEHEVEKVQKY